MARNGNGQYTLPAGNPVVPGTTISTDWANNTLNDIATALTGSVASDGQTAMQGNLDMSNNKIVGLTNGTNPQDAVTVNQLSNAAITGGTINGATIGNTDPKDGNFLNFTANTGDFSVSLTAPTVTPSTDVSNKVATTQFVQNAIAAVSSGVTSFNGRSGVVTLSNTDVNNALGYTPFNAGTSTVVTSDNVLDYTVGKTGQGATGSWGISISGNAASANTANSVESITTNQVSTALGYVPLSPNSPAMNGTPTAPTAPVGTNTTQIATTAFVLANQGGGGGAVQSVNGKTGVVTLSAADVGAYPNSNPNAYTTLAAVQAQGYTTLAQVQSQGYITSSALANYATLNTTQTITGAKTFTLGVTANGFNANGAGAIGDQKFTVSYGGYSSGLSPQGIQIGGSGKGIINDGNYLAMGGITGGAVWSIGANVQVMVSSTDNVQKPSGGPWIATVSDKRFKENIVDYTKGLDAIIALRPVNFTFTGKYAEQTNGETITGFIAQEVLETPLSSMVGENDEGYYNIDTNQISYALINCIKELKAMVDNLQTEVNALKAK